MRIRIARPEDLAAVDALLALSYPRQLREDYPPSLMVTALPLIARAQPRLLASGTYYVAEEGGAILGAGGWTRGIPEDRDSARPGRANIRHLVTDHRRTRQGIGRALMEHSFAAARAAGCDTAHATATRSAVPFYSALGFRTLGPVVVPLAPGIDFPAVAMERAL